MQNIIVLEPYVPVPPRRGTLFPKLFSLILPWFLRKTYGIVEYKFEHLERVQASLKAGHGILLMPNHCRDEDGLVMGRLSCELHRWFFYMGSWHVFKLDPVKSFLLPRLGVYSVYREGADRAAVKTSVDIVAHARRPLVIFPEGFLGRTNDRLNALMEGSGSIARAAARKRAHANPPGQVVIHPVALRYRVLGPLEPGVSPVMAEIESILKITSTPGTPLRERVEQIAAAMLTRYEKEYFGQEQGGSVEDRRAALLQLILHQLEDEWCGQRYDEESVQSRVRRLRIAIVPVLTQGNIDKAEHDRRWGHLKAIYLAQQLDNYPPHYLDGEPTPERLLETIERFQEDLTDKVRPHVPLEVTYTIGEAMVVNPTREGRGSSDPILLEVERQLRAMLGLAKA